MDKSSPVSVHITGNALYHTQAANLHAVSLEREFQHLPAQSTVIYKVLGENIPTCAFCTERKLKNQQIKELHNTLFLTYKTASSKMHL